MKRNFHTHSTWCDGKARPEEMILGAIALGFDTLGFSSHAMLPADPWDWPLTAKTLPRYAAEIRALAAKYDDRIRVLLGVEADYVRGAASPDRSVYATVKPDYIIGSVHVVVAPDGAWVEVDHSPEILQEGIAAYEQALKKHENGFHGAELPNCVQRSVHHGFPDKTQALAAMSVSENLCPVCGRQMRCGRWYPQPGKRFLAQTECETDGAFYVRLRMITEEEGIRVNRLVYDKDSEAAKSYEQLTVKPRRRRKKPAAKEEKTE